MSKIALERQIRFLLIFFMVALSISGLTAIPLNWGSSLLVKFSASSKPRKMRLIFSTAQIGWLSRML
jgi:hypothetical protein